MTRNEVLEAATEAVSGRGRQYGGPESSFSRIGILWSAHLGIEIGPANVAIMMALMKIARLQGNPEHVDSWVDLAGYAACGGEIITTTRPREKRDD